MFQTQPFRSDSAPISVEGKTVALDAQSPSGRFVVLRTYYVEPGFADVVCELGGDCVGLPTASWVFGADDLLVGLREEGDLVRADPETGEVERIAGNVVSFAVPPATYR